MTGFKKKLVHRLRGGGMMIGCKHGHVSNAATPFSLQNSADGQTGQKDPYAGYGSSCLRRALLVAFAAESSGSAANETGAVSGSRE